MIRALQPNDAPAAQAVIHAAFAAQPVVTDPPSAALRETVTGIAAQINSGGGFGAWRGGELTGVVLWRPVPGGLYLGRLAVLPAAHGQGVGRALVAAVETLARQRGLTRVTCGARLALADNRAFFAACGYAETGLETHDGYDAPTSVVLEKPLT